MESGLTPVLPDMASEAMPVDEEVLTKQEPLSSTQELESTFRSFTPVQNQIFEAPFTPVSIQSHQNSRMGGSPSYQVALSQ
jgi:hypothetical protein